MREERNILMRETFPRLQTYYRDKGLQFQVVDMRWGVREEAVLEHQTSALCVSEIREAAAVSRGLAFVALLGDKYGSVPLSPTLSREVFEALTEAAPSSAALLREWFRLDENAEPPEYVLLSLREKEGWGRDAGDFQQRLQAAQRWREQQEKLRGALQTAADAALGLGKLSETERHSFRSAVTENEIREGILSDPLAGQRSLCVLRSFPRFAASLAGVERFWDVGAQGQRDQGAAHLLHKLKEEHIPQHLPETNILRYQVAFPSPEAAAERDEYLSRLAEEVYERIVTLGEPRIAATKFQGSQYSGELFADWCHHLSFAQRKVKEFVGRRKLLVAISRALRKYDFPEFSVRPEGSEEVRPANRPLILHGPSGYGKTSLMAKLAVEFGSGKPSWSDCVDFLSAERVVKVVRFLGTSPLSSRVHNLLLSVITQLEEATGLSRRGERSSFAEICEEFHRLLWALDGQAVLVLVALDAVDQLDGENGAHLLHWLPSDLPANVHLVLSLLDDREDLQLLRNAKRVLAQPKCYLPVTPLSATNVDTVLELYGGLHKRRLTVEQRKAVLAAGVEVPMCLRLAFDAAKGWRSFTPLESLALGRSVKELFHQTLARLEREHGLAAVRALQHITVSKSGLSDDEVEDLLSLDDEVLQDVYIYHLPPEPSVVRLPPSLWRRIRQDIREFLVEKEADGISVVTWYHRSLWEAAAVGLVGQSSRLQAAQIEYFSGQWHGRAKPLSLYKGKAAELADCSRAVPHQPWEFREGQGNLRKLSQLPHAAVLALDADDAARLLTSFDFVRTKLRYLGLKALRDDFRLFFATFAQDKAPDCNADLVYIRYDESWDFGEEGHPNAKAMSPAVLQAKILYDTLSQASDALSLSWEHLCGAILGRLEGFWAGHPLIAALLREARQWATAEGPAGLVPSHQCLQPPGGLLRATLRLPVDLPGRAAGQGPNYASKILALCPSTGLLYAAGQRVEGGDVVEVMEVEKAGEVVQTLRPAASVAGLRLFGARGLVLVDERRDGEGRQRASVYDSQTRAPAQLALAPSIILLAKLLLSVVEKSCRKTCMCFQIGTIPAGRPLGDASNKIHREFG